MTDIRSPVEGDVIDDRGTDYRRLEARGMTDDPARHKATVAIAVDADAITIDIGPVADLVQEGELIGIVLAGPIAEHCHGERAAITRGTAGIGCQHSETGGNHRLLDSIE